MKKITNKNNVVAFRLSKLAVCLSAAMSMTAIAQSDDNEEGLEELEQIVITGSRITRTGMTTPTPVTSMSADDLQNMAPTTLIDGLDQMPQFLGNETSQTQSFGTSGAAGSSFAALRGLSSRRTLILLDSRRVVPATRGGAPNVSLFPEALMKTVDIVTGGASAAYGSDAVAGVVNFILDTSFEGVKGHVQGGMTEAGDGENTEFSLAWGAPVGDRGHLITSGEYFESNGVQNYSDRGWFDSSAMILSTDSSDPTYITANNVHGSNFTEGGLITGGPLAGIQFDENGVPTSFDYGQHSTRSSQIGGSGFDSGENQWMTSDQKRASLFAHFDYELTDSVNVFAQGLYGYSRTSFESAPATMWGYRPATIFIENAYLPESVRQRMVDESVDSFAFGKIQSDYDLGSPFVDNTNEMFQLSAGFDGDIGGWHYDAYYQYGQNTNDLYYDNVARVDRMYQALDTQLVDGQVVCTSSLTNPTDGCVPLNPFGVGTTSSEAREWIMGHQKEQHQVVKQHVAEATISGDLFDLWAGPVSVAAGASYRKEDLISEPRTYPAGLENVSVPTSSEITYRGLPGGYYGSTNIFERTAGSDLEGGYKVTEAFVEAFVPLASDVALIQDLSLNAAARYADYSGSGGIWAWKTGLDWQVYEDLRLRTTVSRDVRAGTLGERFDLSGRGATVTDNSSTDPAINGSRYTISYDQGGNPNVNPEEADTITYGFVYQPSYLDGLSVSVDYFDIKIDGAISLLGVQNIVDDCGAGSLELCALISRADDGRINRIQNVYLNIDEFRTNGVDFEIQYRTDVNLFGGDESLNVRGFATRMLELSQTVPGGIQTDRLGQTGLAGGAPEWQANVSINYQNGPFSLYLQERYIGDGVKRTTWEEGVDVDDNSVDERFYTNLNMSYDLATNSGDWTVYANISNLFDRDPPFAGSTFGFFGSSYTNEGLFDVLGRRFTVGARFRY